MRVLLISQNTYDEDSVGEYIWEPCAIVKRNDLLEPSHQLERWRDKMYRSQRGQPVTNFRAEVFYLETTEGE